LLRDSTLHCNGQAPPWTSVQSPIADAQQSVLGAKMERNWGCGRIMVSRNHGIKSCELSGSWQVAPVTKPARSLFSRDIGLPRPTDLALVHGILSRMTAQSIFRLSKHFCTAGYLLPQALGGIADLLSEAEIKSLVSECYHHPPFLHPPSDTTFVQRKGSMVGTYPYAKRPTHAICISELAVGDSYTVCLGSQATRKEDRSSFGPRSFQRNKFHRYMRLSRSVEAYGGLPVTLFQFLMPTPGSF